MQGIIPYNDKESEFFNDFFHDLNENEDIIPGTIVRTPDRNGMREIDSDYLSMHFADTWYFLDHPAHIPNIHIKKYEYAETDSLENNKFVKFSSYEVWKVFDLWKEHSFIPYHLATRSSLYTTPESEDLLSIILEGLNKEFLMNNIISLKAIVTQVTPKTICNFLNNTLLSLNAFNTREIIWDNDWHYNNLNFHRVYPMISEVYSLSLNKETENIILHKNQFSLLHKELFNLYEIIKKAVSRSSLPEQLPENLIYDYRNKVKIFRSKLI